MLKSIKNRITAAKVGSSSEASEKKKVLIHRLSFLLILLAIWQILTTLKIYPNYLLPSPAEVFDTLYFGFTESNYSFAILHSIKRVLLGYFLAVSVGVFAGLAIARYSFLDNTIGASLTALQAIPSVAWVPLALLWFGISEAAVLFIVILEAFIPSALGVKTAAKTIPQVIIRAAQTLGAKTLDLYIRVIIPAIVPQLVSSLRLSWAFAWRALIAGELFVSGAGIGQTLELGRSLADMSQVLSMILIIAVIGYFTDNIIFRKLEKSVHKRWGFEN